MCGLANSHALSSAESRGGGGGGEACRNPRELEGHLARRDGQEGFVHLVDLNIIHLLAAAQPLSALLRPAASCGAAAALTQDTGRGAKPRTSLVDAHNVAVAAQQRQQAQQRARQQRPVDQLRAQQQRAGHHLRPAGWRPSAAAPAAGHCGGGLTAEVPRMVPLIVCGRKKRQKDANTVRSAS